MAFGTLRFENLSATLERAMPFVERSPHAINQGTQVGRCVAHLAPNRLNLLVESGIVKGANPQNGIISQVVPRNLFLSHGSQKSARPCFAPAKQVHRLAS